MTDIKQQTKKQTPEFKNRQEMAEFWDTHDFTEYTDGWEKTQVRVELEKDQDDTIVLHEKKGIKDKLAKVAESKGLKLATLARMWLLEKLQTTQP